jgi:hypothetical protein
VTDDPDDKIFQMGRNIQRWILLAINIVFAPLALIGTIQFAFQGLFVFALFLGVLTAVSLTGLVFYIRPLLSKPVPSKKTG